LLAQGREEGNYTKANSKQDTVHDSIVRGDQLELYDDVERLLPADAHPICVEMDMPIEQYDHETAARDRLKDTGKPTRKRKRAADDPARNIPAGAQTGFVSVSQLITNQHMAQKRRKTKKQALFDEHAGEDDEMDLEIEAGLIAAPRRTSSSPVVSTSKGSGKAKEGKGKGKAKRSTSAAETSKKAQAKPKKAAVKPKKAKQLIELTSSQFARQGADDSEDETIERGLSLAKKAKDKAKARARSPRSPLKGEAFGSSRPASPDAPPQRKSPPEAALQSAASPEISQQQLEGDFLDLCTPSAESSRSPSPARHVSSQPLPRRSTTNSPFKRHLSEVVRTRARLKTPSPPPGCEDDVSWLLAGSDDSPKASRSPIRTKAKGKAKALVRGQSINITDSEPDSRTYVDVEVICDDGDGEPSAFVLSSPILSVPGPSRSVREMLPPAIVPLRLAAPPVRMEIDIDSSPAAPTPSFPVRASRTKKRPAPTADSSSPLAAHPPMRKRLQHGRLLTPTPSPPPSPRPKKKKAIKIYDTAAAARRNVFLDVEAGHSADDTSAGSDDGGAPGADGGSDGGFLAEPGAPQVSPSYDQFAMYRQSLLSQAPARARAPAFPRRPVRHGPFGRGAEHGVRQASSSPVARGDEEDEMDEYEFGSFVVDDEAEISFEQSSEV
jgi:ATP-dependent DNA helicase MPH1